MLLLGNGIRPILEILSSLHSSPPRFPNLPTKVAQVHELFLPPPKILRSTFVYK